MTEESYTFNIYFQQKTVSLSLGVLNNLWQVLNIQTNDVIRSRRSLNDHRLQSTDGDVFDLFISELA